MGDIAEKLSARQSLISQHLALLRKDGLVRPRRDGQTIRYALADEKAQRLIGVLYEILLPGEARLTLCIRARSDRAFLSPAAGATTSPRKGDSP